MVSAPRCPALFLSPPGLALTLPPPFCGITLFAFLSRRTWGGVVADCIAHLWLPAHRKGCFQRSSVSSPSGQRLFPGLLLERSSTWLSLSLTPLADVSSLWLALWPLILPQSPQGTQAYRFYPITSSFPHRLALSCSFSFLLCPGRLWPLASHLVPTVPPLAPVARSTPPRVFTTLKFNFI